MKIERIPISQINPAPYNPRKDLKPGDREYEKLKRSIQKFDIVEPLVWNKRTGNLVGGHQRLKIIKNELGMTEAEVSVVDLDEKSEKALNVALNKISGDWDIRALKELLVDLDDGSFDLTLTGFDELELKELIDFDGAVGLGSAADDETPEAPKDPITKPGDLYLLDGHRLLCGDAANVTDVKRLMDGTRAAMTFTDPPYNIDYGNIKHPKFKVRSIANDSMGAQEWSDFCRDVVAMIAAFTEGCVYVCHAPGKDGRVIATVLDESLHCSTTIVWVKDVFTLGRGKYQNQYEPIWFGWVNDGANFVSARDLANVWNIARPKRSEEHPTMKPVELVAKAVSHASQAGDVVLDLFGGSGTTMIACEKLKRRAYLMELDPAYCDVIVQRWETFSGKKAVRSTIQEAVGA